MLMTKLGRTTVVPAVSLIAFALAASGCGGSSDSEESKASTVERPSAEPPVYHLAEYDMETGWTKETLDRKEGDYLESVWHDPASFSSKLIIDSRPAEGAPPPMMSAELTRTQANWLPKYRERSLKRVNLGGHPAIRLAFFAAGEDRIEYFFEECGVSIAFRGSTVPIAYEPFSEFYGTVASRIKPVCEE
jgi:hypothetical protein